MPLCQITPNCVCRMAEEPLSLPWTLFWFWFFYQMHFLFSCIESTKNCQKIKKWVNVENLSKLWTYTYIYVCAYTYIHVYVCIYIFTGH